VKCDGRVLVIKTADLDWIEAADNYVNLHLANETRLMRETMNSLESKLSPETFLRISRSIIVNLERIKELQPMFHGEYVVVLKNGTKLTLTRNYRDKLDRLMGGA
jgi:two-component system LytT family response regulator